MNLFPWNNLWVPCHQTTPFPNSLPAPRGPFVTSDLSLGKGKAGDFQVTQSPGEAEAKQKVYSLGMEQKEQLADPEVETDSPQGAEKKDQERADPGGSGKAAGRPRPHHGVREEQNTCPTSQRGEGGPK